MSNWTPADIAAYDQDLAATQAKLYTLVTATRLGTQEVGKIQALADIAAVLSAEWDATQLLGLLMAAIHLLAFPAGQSATRGDTGDG